MAVHSTMDDGTAVRVLRALGEATSRTLLAVEPVTEDGQIVDGIIIWSSGSARRRNPGLAPGARISDVAASGQYRMYAIGAALAAFANPGVSATSGPHTTVIDGEERQLSVSALLEAGLLLVEYHDVTDLIRSEHARETTEHDFRQLMDGLDAGIVVLRPLLREDGTFDDAELLWSNESSKRMWLNQEGLQPGTFVSEVYYDRADWLRAANTAWQGTPTSRMLRVDPAIAPWSAATETLRRVGDTLVEMTLDRSQDQMLLERLADADHRFAAVMEDLPVTVLVASMNDDVLEYVSPNAEQLTGLPLHRLRRVTEWVSLIHPADIEQVMQVEPVLRTTGRYVGTLRYRPSGGRSFTASVRCVRREGPSGHDGVITIITDITEQLQLRERVESGTRLETLGRTAGSIAHDFNNLLMIVGGNIDRARLQLQQGTIHERGALVLETAAVAAQRAADLSNSLLAFARGRQGAPEVVHVDRLLRNFEPILRGIVYPRVELERPYADDAWSVYADTAHLQQIVMNLVTNARDASPDGGKVTVEVALADAARCHLVDEPAVEPHVAITVRDEGPGVPADISTRIWEPFFSGKEVSHEAGNGLGLSTVHGLVHQYGGHVAVDNHPDGGCSFTVYLPLHDPAR